MRITLQVEDFIRGIIIIWFTRSCPSAKPCTFGQRRLHWIKIRRNCKNLPAWKTCAFRSKQDGINEARDYNRKVNFAAVMDACHLKHAELAETPAEISKQSGSARRQRQRRSIHVVIHYSPNKEHQLLFLTAAKVLDTVSWSPGMSGDANDAVSAKPQVKMSDAPRLL